MIISKIPIQNIYYLLCYSWNKLEEKDIVQVSDIDSTNILDLFAKVLIQGVKHLFKRGLDRGYIANEDQTKCLRGKICFGPTYKKNLLAKAQIHCEFDEFSHNVLHNQILKSTIGLLIDYKGLNRDLQNELLGLFRKMQQIDDIELRNSLFSRVQLHRNNAFYDFLLKICEIIHENLLISEDPGKSKFRDFFRDEHRMASVFENFVRNFYKIEVPGCKVKSEVISWDAILLDESSNSYLPKMITDVSIEFEDFKVVIEAKYYKKALLEHYGKEKYHSVHFYQLFSYLKNLEAKGGLNTNASGILLYPTAYSEKISEGMILNGHKVMVQTINLNQDWQLIQNDLIELLTVAKAA
ncbi:McrC: methyl-coenzyme M reductase operon protein C [Desulfosarcina variabilis str. Montpellier]|uniref:5-methylcytosine-specific restriction endonuclease system specificity protein McrC n=1 Tax=Desulfosarcina variabilis TaxID=2300 RepID=UPI003AFB6BBF